MPLYRALRNLSNGIDQGVVFDQSRLQAKSIPILEERGAIAIVSTPPLAEFPGWKIRGAKFAKLGIETVDQFMEVDIEQTAKSLKVKPQIISAWRYEIVGWLSAPKPKGG